MGYFVAEPRPRTGVVAIGRNEGERLRRCLHSLQGSGCPIVYVDSDSNDGSRDAATKLGTLVVPLDLSLPFTAARARAEGFAALNSSHADLETVFFVDGDCEVEEGFLANAGLFLVEHPDFAVVCGRRRERFPDASRYNRLIDREWDTAVGETTACGGDALIRISAYREAGGFDPRMLAGEEPELCARLRRKGWRIMRIDAPMTIHDAAMHRFSQWWRRAIRSGMGYAQAWSVTRNGEGAGLYQKELLRALIWAGALPLIGFALAMLVNPVLILFWPGLTGLQFVRLSVRDDTFASFLSIIGKYAELTGITRFAMRRLRGRVGSTVTYK